MVCIVQRVRSNVLHSRFLLVVSKISIIQGMKEQFVSFETYAEKPKSIRNFTEVFTNCESLEM